MWSSPLPYLIIVNYGTMIIDGLDIECFMMFRWVQLKIPLIHNSQRLSWQLIFTTSNRRYDSLVSSVGSDLTAIQCLDPESDLE